MFSSLAMPIAVINYNAGNTRSVLNALKRAGEQPVLTADPSVISSASGVILPGQGEASNVMQSLRDYKLVETLLNLRQPVLGICIGLQLFCEYSEEGETVCMGMFPGTRVRHFHALSTLPALKVPHMGWNSLHGLRSPLFQDMSEGTYVYFVHSFCATPTQDTCATCEYGGVSFAAAMQRGNFYATQFHPEKSGRAGEQIIRNFISLCHD